MTTTVSSAVLSLNEILFLCKTQKWLHGLENVSISIGLSSKWVKLQF